MEGETRVLIEVRLERSQEDMEAAKELLNLGRYRAAVNRSYYAILGATAALLLTEKKERSKHSGIRVYKQMRKVIFQDLTPISLAFNL